MINMKLLALLSLSGCLSLSLAKAQNGVYPIFETDKIASSELKQRRAAIHELVGKGNIAVFFTNPERNRNNDVDFIFRGDSNFLYLTGFEEPGAALIMVPGGFAWKGKTITELLFLNLPNIQSETWLGYRMGPDNAVKILGIDAATSNSEFEEAMKAAAAASPGAKVSSSLPPQATGGELGQMVATFQDWRKTSGAAAGANLRSKLSEMRGIKSAAEVAFLRKVSHISAIAHCEVMRSVQPGMREWDLAAIDQFVFARMGCEFAGYPPIVGSGPNSTILHYESNRRLLQAGDIVCMDSAGEFHGYSADVTRSFPVSGKFSPEQKSIYEVVLKAQNTGISMCKPGTNMGDIENAIRKDLSDGLIKLGIIKSAGELGRYYMHGFGHGIGLDVHDPVPFQLAAGAALTVEPGIYIKAGSPCDKKWWNIGVRIEDDILVTAAGPENMSAAAPRTVNDIEKLMAEKGIGNEPLRPWK